MEWRPIEFGKSLVSLEELAIAHFDFVEWERQQIAQRLESYAGAGDVVQVETWASHELRRVGWHGPADEAGSLSGIAVIGCIWHLSESTSTDA